MPWGKRKYADEQVFNALREAAARLGRTPSPAEYAALRALQPGWPHPAGIIRRYRGWRAALAAAGLVPRRPARNWRLYSDEQLLEALREAAAAGAFTVAEYDRYARQRGLPSSNTVRFRFGSWDAAWRAAGLLRPWGLARNGTRRLAWEAGERARAVLTRRAFLVRSDVGELGIPPQHLSRLARELDVPVARIGRMADALARAAEQGFPECGVARYRDVALRVARLGSMQAAARELGMTRERVRQLLRKYLRKVGCLEGNEAGTRRGRRRKVTREFLERTLPAFLRWLARLLGRKPRRADYDAYRPEGWPPANTVNCYASWRRLLRRALGVPAGDRPKARRLVPGTERHYPPHVAAEVLGVTRATLHRWEKEGKIRCIRTPSGHRRFPEDEILRLLGKAPTPSGAGEISAGERARVPELQGLAGVGR